MPGQLRPDGRPVVVPQEPQRRDRALCPVSTKTDKGLPSFVSLNEGTGRYARSDSEIAHLGLAERASTKGPGVMPGQESVKSTEVPVCTPQRRDRALCPVSCRTPPSRRRAPPRLNEGTGRYARSARGCRTLLSEFACLNEGTGRYARSARHRVGSEVRPDASTKGPGVMPGQFKLDVGVVDAVNASTKGPGVMPGQIDRVVVQPRVVGASTKGPGVMPGQVLLMDYQPHSVCASTKGPGVMPGQRSLAGAGQGSAQRLNEGTGRYVCLVKPDFRLGGGTAFPYLLA